MCHISDGKMSGHHLERRVEEKEKKKKHQQQQQRQPQIKYCKPNDAICPFMCFLFVVFLFSWAGHRICLASVFAVCWTCVRSCCIRCMRTLLSQFSLSAKRNVSEPHPVYFCSLNENGIRWKAKWKEKRRKEYEEEEDEENSKRRSVGKKKNTAIRNLM